MMSPVDDTRSRMVLRRLARLVSALRWSVMAFQLTPFFVDVVFIVVLLLLLVVVDLAKCACHLKERVV